MAQFYLNEALIARMGCWVPLAGKADITRQVTRKHEDGLSMGAMIKCHF
jgi:hypothetical protein